MEAKMDQEQTSSSCDVLSSTDKDSICSAVITILQKNGITSSGNELFQIGDHKNGSSDKKKTSRAEGTGRVFGLSLENTGQGQDRRMTESDGRPCYLPRFFVESIEFLKKNVTTEGLFRKAGSLNRQRGLRSLIEKGSSIPSSSNAHDVAALLKQYLRELTEPLMTKRLTPLLLECTRALNEENNSDQYSITRSQAILMISLLLPTQHLLCLKILMRLLNQVAAHRKESLMDSRGLAVVIGPNILPPQSSSLMAGDNKKTKKGGGGGEGPNDAKLGVNNMTRIVSTLIDHAHLIGQIPPLVQELAEEIHAKALESNYCKKKKKHKRHETVSLLLRETFSKIRGGKKTQDSPGTMSGDDLLNSPDGLGPSACKRVAFDESSDLSDKSVVTSPASCVSSPSSNSSSIRKKLFKGKTKRHYSILRKGGEGSKMSEEVPLLGSRDCQDDLFPNIPSSPLLQTHNLITVSPLCTTTSSTILPSPITNTSKCPKILPNMAPGFSSIIPPSSNSVPCSSTFTLPNCTNDVPLICFNNKESTSSSSTHVPSNYSSSVSSSKSSIPSQSSTTTCTTANGASIGSSYKLVSKTRKTYQKDKRIATPYNSKVSNVCSSGSRGPLKGDHSLRKRKQYIELPRSRSNQGDETNNNNMTPLTNSRSDFTLSSSNVTASTPVRERPRRIASSSGAGGGHRRLTIRSDQLTNDDNSKHRVSSSTNKMDDTLETVVNNDSYLRAVGMTPLRKVLHEVGNESPPPPPPPISQPISKIITNAAVASQQKRKRRSISMRATPNTHLLPHTPVVQSSISKSGSRKGSAKPYSIVKSHSMNRHDMTTARSPWINSKGIQVSEWII